MNQQDSFIIGHLYVCIHDGYAPLIPATRLPNGKWDGSSIASRRVAPKSIALIVDKIGINWAIALIGDHLVWLYNADCVPL